MKITFIRDYLCYKTGQSFEINQHGGNFLVGNNGAGKTTIIDIMNSRSFKLKKDKYFTVEGTYQQKSKILNSEGFRVPKSQIIDNRDDVYRIQLNHRSHGEAWKDQISKLKKQFDHNMFLIMDEPETSLSMESQIEVAELIMEFMNEYENTGFLIATHSIIMLEILQGQVIEVPELRVVSTDEYLKKRYSVMAEVKGRAKKNKNPSESA